MEEHQPVAGAMLAEPAGAVPQELTAGLDDPRALQILSTEHWSLLSARSLAYNEAFSRTGMFLSFLSATLIVMGFLLSSSTISGATVPVIWLLLVADAYVGAATLGRLLSASAEELQAVRGMNRIRHAYRDMVPGLAPYFVTGFHDDAAGVLATYGGVHRSAVGHVLHGFTTAIGMVATIESFVIGALLSVLALELGLPSGVAIGLGIAAVVVAFTAFSVVGIRSALVRQRQVASLFPSPPDA